MKVIFNLLLLVLIKSVTSARILAIIPSPAYSHQTTFRQIWKELSLRGHEVVLLTTDPMNDKQLTNLREIDLHFIYDEIRKSEVDELVTSKFAIFQAMNRLVDLIEKIQRLQLMHSEVQNLIHNQTEHFDLVMVEYLMPSYFAFSHRFKCPLVTISSTSLPQHAYYYMGQPNHPAVYPSHLLPFYTNLSFFERVLSTLWDIAFHFYVKTCWPQMEIVIRDNFGEGYPTIFEMKQKIALNIANTNPVLSLPKPTVPGLVEIGGGVHITDPKPIPKDILDFLDGDQAVIYVSFGSTMKNALVTAAVQTVLCDAFVELDYKILWKFDNNSIIKEKENIKIVPWVPQQDVLRHSNVKAFVSQMGLQSLEESLYAHVPLVGIPMVADQAYNGVIAEEIGIGITLNKDVMDKDTLIRAIVAVLSDSKYKDNMKRLAALSRDQPMSGVEKAVWWTEYVIRHKGATHLRSPLADIPLYQYYHLDVICFVVVILAACLCIFIYVCKCLYSIINRKTNIKRKIK